MTRVLLRSAKDPFTPVSPEVSLVTGPRGLFGRNVGNLVFTDAVHKLLSVPGSELVSNSFLTERPGADKAYIERINDEFDVFVIPLANAFRPKFLDNLVRLTKVIKRLRIPVVVVGVGVAGGVGSLDNPFPAPTAELRNAVVGFVRAVLDHSATIGVRGEFTREYLAGLGFGDDLVDVVGCPSLFRDGPNLRVEKRTPALDAESRFTINVSPYVKQMDAIVRRHTARYPQMVYIPQGDEVLDLMLWGTEPADAHRPDLPHHTRHPLYLQDRMRFFVDTSTWMRYLSAQDFSFGTRIHGNIVALSARTPAYVLAHDSRTLELARYHEIPHTLVPELPKAVDAADLYQQADYGPFNAGQAARWDRFAGFLERNGLEHVFQPGKADPGYEERLAAVDLPAPVTTLATRDPEAQIANAARIAALYSLRGRALIRAAHPLDLPFAPATPAPADPEARSWPAAVPQQVRGTVRRLARQVRGLR